MKSPLTVIAFAGLLAVLPASAATITFDFETVPITGLNFGAYSSLSMTRGGLTMSLSRASGTGFDIVGNDHDQSGKPAEWGERSLSPFRDVQVTGDYWIASFSVAINSFSAQAGDYGGDNDIPVSLTAYSQPGATGSVVASSSFSGWSTTSTFPEFVSIGISGLGINSVAFTSDSDYPLSDTPFPNSLFWDNLTVDVDDSLLAHSHSAPDAGSTLGLMGLGLLCLVGLRKQRR